MAKSKQKQRVLPPTKAAVDRRLKLLEVEMAELLAETGKPIGVLPHGMNDIVGAFRGDDDFVEAMKIGAKWRASFRPKPVSKVKKRASKRGKHAGT